MFFIFYTFMISYVVIKNFLLFKDTINSADKKMRMFRQKYWKSRKVRKHGKFIVKLLKKLKYKAGGNHLIINEAEFLKLWVKHAYAVKSIEKMQYYTNLLFSAIFDNEVVIIKDLENFNKLERLR